MSLPRSKLYANKTYHAKNAELSIRREKNKLFNNICAKYGVYEMNFRDPIIINDNGETYNVNAKKIYCNMKASSMVIVFDSIEPMNKTYDVYEMKKSEGMSFVNKQLIKINKHGRNFMEVLSRKIGLTNANNYSALEIKYGATDMIIEYANIYEINMSNNKERYLLIHGDIDPKSKIVDKLNPNREEWFKEKVKFVDNLTNNNELN